MIVEKQDDFFLEIRLRDGRTLVFSQYPSGTMRVLITDDNQGQIDMLLTPEDTHRVKDFFDRVVK